MKKIVFVLFLMIAASAVAQVKKDTMYVYLKDNIIERFAVNDIDSVTFVSPVYSFDDIYTFYENKINKIYYYLRDSETEYTNQFKIEFLNWLNGQNHIENTIVKTDACFDEYDIRYKNGEILSLIFISEDYLKEEKSFAKSLAKTKDCQLGYNFLPEEKGEIIIPEENLNVLIMKPLRIMANIEADDEFENNIKNSPINIKIDCLNDLNEIWINKLSEYGFILLTKTHGVSRIPASFSADCISYDNFMFVTKVLGNREYSFYWGLGSYLTPQISYIIPLEKLFLNRIKNNAILYADYCWSFSNSRFNNDLNGNFIGYQDISYNIDNMNKVFVYTLMLLNGYTHEAAVNHVKSQGYADFYSNNKIPKQRYFSIRTGESKDNNGKVLISGKINGYKNLKEGISYRIYYSKNKYETPDSDMEFIEVTPDNSGNIEVEISVPEEGVKYYYTIAMEYGSQIYYGEVKTFEIMDDNMAVDLGLSVKWAKYNIGATKPEECGEFYSWGETEVKSSYTDKNYKHCKGNFYTNLTKYCTRAENGIVDNKTILEPEDDVAHVKWGGNWRIPTPEEVTELKQNCTWEWVIINGVNGFKATSKKNGNSIFLPSTKYYSTFPKSMSCLLWTNTLSHVPYKAYCSSLGGSEDPDNGQLNVNTFLGWTTDYYRYDKCVIRPVKD